MAELVHPVRVEWSDCDPAGILFYGNVFRWIDSASHRLMREIGLTRDQALGPDVLVFAVVEAQCQFVAPAVYDDRLEVCCRVGEIKRRAIRLDFRVVRPQPPGEPLPVATAYEWRVLVTRGPAREMLSVDVPPALRRALEGFRADELP